MTQDSALKSSPKPFAFVLMAFDKKFDDVYRMAIKGACKIANVYCERVDEQNFDGSILQRIYNQISKADVVIADMTGRNPNVFYETGYAHALGKRVILLTQNADDIPFDLKHYPHIVYESGLALLQDQLSERITWAVQEGADKPHGHVVEVAINGTPISEKNVVHGHCFTNKKKKKVTRYYSRIMLTIQNRGAKEVPAGAFSVGLIARDQNDKLHVYYSKQNEVPWAPKVRLDANHYLFMLPNLERLFPEEASGYSVGFSRKDSYPTGDFRIRLFWPWGNEEHGFKLEQKTQEESQEDS